MGKQILGKSGKITFSFKRIFSRLVVLVDMIRDSACRVTLLDITTDILIGIDLDRGITYFRTSQHLLLNITVSA